MTQSQIRRRYAVLMEMLAGDRSDYEGILARVRLRHRREEAWKRQQARFNARRRANYRAHRLAGATREEANRRRGLTKPRNVPSLYATEKGAPR